jgi:hypothetical protein
MAFAPALNLSSKNLELVALTAKYATYQQLIIAHTKNRRLGAISYKPEQRRWRSFVARIGITAFSP